MKATLIKKSHAELGDNRFVEIVVWQVPQPVPASGHLFKYRLAYVVNGVCLLRYDNEAGKGDHKHVGAGEVPYTFTTPEQLMLDFWAELAQLGE